MTEQELKEAVWCDKNYLQKSNPPNLKLSGSYTSTTQMRMKHQICYSLNLASKKSKLPKGAGVALGFESSSGVEAVVVYNAGSKGIGLNGAFYAGKTLQQFASPDFDPKGE